MSSTVAHAISASFVAVTFANVNPNETSYVLAAIASASILDLDHLFYIIRDREVYRQLGYQGNLHNSRSVFHELLGLLIVGVVSALLFFVDEKLARVIFIAFTLHLVQDWLVGKSFPFTPVDNTVMQFFSLTMKQKVFIDVVIVMMFGGLWIAYLAGGL